MGSAQLFARGCAVALLLAGSAVAQEDPSAVDINGAILKGLGFLESAQNEDGSWGGLKNATFTSSFANHATYRAWQMGATALATRTMLEVGVGEDAQAAADRGLEYLMAHAEVKRPAEWDVDNNWALIYGLDTVARALQHRRHVDSELTPKLRSAGQLMVAGLAKYQSPRGGWGYYSDPGSGWRPDWATSFTTAAGLLALIEARAAGLEVGEKMYNAAVRAVEHSRLPNGAYDYEVHALPRHLRLESINQVKGSLGRIQVCNLALWRAGGKVTAKDLVWGLEQFTKYHKFLDVARNKPIPHEAYYANAAYFYLFAHYYAAQVLELLPADERAKWAPHVQAGILKCQQENGSMWDFWIAASTKPYGTAFGIMGLDHTLPPGD